MAKLYFRYGTMNSGKSIDILKIANNYEEQGKRAMLLTSPLDDREGVGIISSRIGIKREAILLSDDVFERAYREMPDCVIIDEVQFASAYQIDCLAMIVDKLEIPVLAYGLMTSFKGNLFSMGGVQRLLELADRIEEIKTICWKCNSKARFNTRYKNGFAVFEGEEIEIGGNDKYLPLCRKCYMQEREGLVR